MAINKNISKCNKMICNIKWLLLNSLTKPLLKKPSGTERLKKKNRRKSSILCLFDKNQFFQKQTAWSIIPCVRPGIFSLMHTRIESSPFKRIYINWFQEKLFFHISRLEGFRQLSAAMFGSGEKTLNRQWLKSPQHS